jgi:hypothetical protein
MRRVIVSEFVSLDGVIEDPGGAEGFERGAWSFQFDRGPDEGDKFKFDELAAADALLLGRVTYEGFAAAWPQMEEQAGEYGAWMNGYPKYVAPRRWRSPSSGTTLPSSRGTSPSVSPSSSSKRARTSSSSAAAPW